jgi:hypothetical protein
VNSHALSERLLRDELDALGARLDRLRPFKLLIPMTVAAQPSKAVLERIDHYMLEQKRSLASKLDAIKTEFALSSLSLDQQHRECVRLKLLFNQVLEQFDIFADGLTQRSEQTHDLWLSGLDVAANDALWYPDKRPRAELMTYLDRGLGAAIRRARTRLPGGGENPVAMVRIPRERMVGIGIAGSLFHEVGHQASHDLGLLSRSEQLLKTRMAHSTNLNTWLQWRSEILSDVWALSRLGVAATLGLMSVLSLPNSMVYRPHENQPHPIPWIRMMLSFEVGEQLFPDPQWQALRRSWLLRYPLRQSNDQAFYRALLADMPQFVQTILMLSTARQEPPLIEHSSYRARTPHQLRGWIKRKSDLVDALFKLSPTKALSVIGQARSDGVINSEIETLWVHRLLQHWALNGNPAQVVRNTRRTQQGELL